MEWRDEGMLIGSRKLGETSAIAEIFTAEHGRHLGVVRGGASRRMAALMQPGSQVTCAWRARLDDHLGVFVLEPLRSRAGLMEDRARLAGLASVCSLLHMGLPERAAHPQLYARTLGLMTALERDGTWPADYLRWELVLLEDLGFGLDLARCAVTGSREDLAWVSPRSGRAVSRQGAGDWAARLLPLPAGLLGQGPLSPTELSQGLAITGHFLARGPGTLHPGAELPAARTRLVDLLTA